MYEDPTQPLRTESLELPSDVTLEGCAAARPAPHSRERPPTPGADFDAHYDKALSLLESSGRAGRFGSPMKPPAVRDPLRPDALRAVVPARPPVIEATPLRAGPTGRAGSDTSRPPGPDGSWDTHATTSR